MASRRYKVNVGEFFIIPILSRAEREETQYAAEWAPQIGEPCVLAQVVLQQGKHGSLSVAFYDKMFLYGPDLLSQVDVSTLKVSHMMETQKSYFSWGAFKKIAIAVELPRAPLQLYRYNGLDKWLSLTPFGVLYFYRPDEIDSRDFMSSGKSVTCELVIDLLRYIHTGSPDIPGIVSLADELKVRDHGRLESFLGPVSRETLQTFFNHEDPNSGFSQRPYGAATEQPWEQASLLLAQHRV